VEKPAIIRRLLLENQWFFLCTPLFLPDSGEQLLQNAVHLPEKPVVVGQRWIYHLHFQPTSRP
jgi:hypothetical protein